ncbi:hypothetical protein [Desulfopila inferna]|uniref:hypothetical protein n=1 Tax=Desulfopila inferna TaxID=468528 RepID=UPI001962C248|nr:hypothetical protein [Desulfopila inferna]MBM9604676.1 hypothetical protein [Desulfopila inferna]
MNKEPKPTAELIKLLEEHEKSIGALYEAFASLFPLFKKEWLDFAEEEYLHAGWIKKLHTHQQHGKIAFQQTRITIQSIKTAINYLETQKDRALAEKPDLAKCLDLAINVEKSLLEGSFFKVFQLTTPETQKIREKLEKATRTHINELGQWRAGMR